MIGSCILGAKGSGFSALSRDTKVSSYTYEDLWTVCKHSIALR